MAAALIAGCANSDKAPGNGPRNKSLRFAFSTPNAFIDARTAGTGDENGTAADNVVFYQFDATGNYETRYDLDCTDGVAGNGVTTYTLDTSGATTGEKRFVVLQSDDENNFPAMTTSNTISDLVSSLTVAETGVVAAPFVMSNTKDSNGDPYITVADILNTMTPIEVKLKRRVARFDMVNDPSVSGLDIDAIHIKNRRTQAFLGDVSGSAGSVTSGTQQIPAASLTNEGKSFYVYPTVLTSTVDQATKTVLWVTTKLTGTNIAGPTLSLELASDINIAANNLYQLNVNNVGASASLSLTVADWEDGSSVDWIAGGDGFYYTDDSKVAVTNGTEIKGKHIKIGSAAPIPFTISYVKTDANSADISITQDGSKPSWLTISSLTTEAGTNLYRHEVTYTVTARPSAEMFAITYPTGSTNDQDLIVIGFQNPYPGTPLPCLVSVTESGFLYSPTHANQSTYLTHNNTDLAFFAGATGYTLSTRLSSSTPNTAAHNPCPAGWVTLNSAQGQDYIDRAANNLKTQTAGSASSLCVYTYQWYANATDATYLRIQAGYARNQATPTYKDLACFGTWPYAMYAQVNLPGLGKGSTNYGTTWAVKTGTAVDYGMVYRCARAKAGWN